MKTTKGYTVWYLISEVDVVGVEGGLQVRSCHSEGERAVGEESTEAN